MNSHPAAALRSAQMQMTASLYTLYDMTLGVRWEDAALRPITELTLAYSGVRRLHGPEPLPADAWSVTVTAAPAPPHGAECTETSRDAQGATLYAADDRLVFARGASEAHVTPSARTATLYIANGDAATTDLYLLLMYVLVAVVHEHGYTVLHAGALCYSSGDDGLLFVAQSDSGKSTLTFGLIRQGWPFLTDDSVLLRLEDGEVVVRPFRWDGSVDPHARDTFPEIAEHRLPFLPDVEKWRVDLDSAFPDQRRTTCRPRVLVFPQIEDVPESRLTPASRSDAFMHLLQLTSVFALQRETTDAQLELLNQLTRQAKAYALRNGHDLRDAPGTVADLLRPVLA